MDRALQTQLVSTKQQAWVCNKLGLQLFDSLINTYKFIYVSQSYTNDVLKLCSDSSGHKTLHKEQKDKQFCDGKVPGIDEFVSNM